jgi:hypothetical protein
VAKHRLSGDSGIWFVDFPTPPRYPP